MCKGMCGRIVDDTRTEEWEAYFDVPKPRVLRRYNIAPTDDVAILLAAGGKRHGALARWGLIPPGMSLEDARRYATFNARVEGITSSRSFRQPFLKRRCLVPVRGLYEWTKRPGGGKIPYFIHRRDDKPLVLAGIYETRAFDGIETHTLSILTREAGPEVEAIHDREPVALLSRDFDAWLDADTPQRDLTDLAVRPFPRGVLVIDAAHPDVNKVGNDGAHLIAKPRWHWEVWRVPEWASSGEPSELLAQGVQFNEDDAKTLAVADAKARVMHLAPVLFRLDEQGGKFAPTDVGLRLRVWCA